MIRINKKVEALNEEQAEEMEKLHEEISMETV
jgi:putative tricarboxylic transport membrane protein